MSSDIGVGVGGNERIVSSSCIDEIAVDQPKFSAIVVAVTGIGAESTIVQLVSIILRFAVCHSENDLRAAIIPNDDIELMAIGYTFVEVTQLPSLTLSRERGYSNLIMQDNFIRLTAVLATVNTPQNGTCASLSGARKRILVAGVSEGSIMCVRAGSSVTT